MNNQQREILGIILRFPEAISLRYIPFFMVATFPLLLVEDHIWEFTWQERFQITLARLSGYALMYLYFRFIKFTYIALKRKSIQFPVFVILSGTGGAIQDGISGTLMDLMGINTQVSTINRTITAFLMALSWLPINALATYSISKFREDRAELLKRSEQIARIAFEQEGLAKKIRSRIEHDIVEELKLSRDLARSKFQFSIDKGINASNMNPLLIKEYANKDLRGISHRLWGQAGAKSGVKSRSKPSELRELWELYRMSYFLPPVDSVIQTFILATLFLPILLREYSPEIQVSAALMFSIVFYSTLLFGGFLYRRFPDLSPFIIPVRTFGAAAISVFTSILLEPEVWNTISQAPLPRLVSGILVFFLADVAIAISKSTLYSQSEQSTALYRSIGNRKAQLNLANLEISLVSREWAQYIHGTLAGKLRTSAAILENTVATVDLTAKEAAIAEANRVMSEDFYIPQRINRDLMQELMFRVSQWNSLIEIEVHGTATLDSREISVEKFGLAIEDALANSFRHGNAKSVTINLKQIDEHSFECSIVDDGVGLGNFEREGLGSALFESLAPGLWSRTSGPNGLGVQVQMLIIDSPNSSTKNDI